MLELGEGFDRRRIREALEHGEPLTIHYKGVLRDVDIREAVAGVRDAGNPEEGLPLLAWVASHPNAPEDVLCDLLAQGTREVLMSLCLNPNLPEDLRRRLLDHEDSEVAEHANHVFSHIKPH